MANDPRSASHPVGAAGPRVFSLALEAAIPPTAVAGTRYDPHQMRILDSER
jgi:hypothetical protein